MAIKNLTYRNFIIVMNKIKAKGYTDAEAEDITRKVFDNYYSDKGRGDRSVEWFIGMVMTKEAFELEQRMLKEEQSEAAKKARYEKRQAAKAEATLTEEEQAMVDAYMDKTDAMVFRFCGLWVISLPEDRYEYKTKAELLKDIRYNLDEIAKEAYAIESVEPEYTGGGFYVFAGKLTNGNYFIADNDMYNVRILDTPYDWDTNFEVEWQEAHLVKDLGAADALQFCKQMVAWVKEHKPDGNYALADMDFLAEDIEECLEREAEGKDWR